MSINPLAYTEKVIRSFLRYQVTTYPFADVKLEDGELKYGVFDYESNDWKKEIIPLTEEQWAAFRDVLDSLDVWNLEEEYVEPGICDGTSWHLDIEYDDKNVHSRGQNKFPGNAETVEDSAVFTQFLRAVQTLAGDWTFR